MKRNITTYPRAPPFPVWFQIIKITNQTEEFKMAKDFYKSNYGINKNSKGIVYRYADGSVLEITFEKIAAGNPSFTKEDFDKIKELSDKFYHEEAKADCNYHHHVTGSYDNVEDSVWLATESLEDELMKRADEAEFSNKIRDAIATMLTATEKRRFLLYAFRGLPNHHQAIVSHELFDKVQSVRRTCKFNGRKTHTYPLRTKVVCGCCNHAMQRLPQKEITFACQYTRHDEKEPCYNLRVSEKELHKVLFDIISKQAEIILNINDITELDNLQLKTEQTVELEKQIENCRKEKQHLYEQLLTRKITLDEYQMLKENCDADMRDYELQYDRSCRELEQTKNDNQTREKFIQIAKDVKKENTLTQALADMLIDKVLVYPDKRIDVIWKMQDFCRDIDITEMS